MNLNAQEPKNTEESNKETREISFPAKVEMPAAANSDEHSIIEYVLVNPTGKIHETLFVTNVKPSHLNVAYKLLGYKESKHLFRKVNDDLIPEDEYESTTPEQKKLSQFKLSVQWKDSNGKVITKQINELIHNHAKNQPMTAGSWVYGGSYIYNGQFQADVSRDIFAIFTDSGAIGNYAGDGREDDTLWSPNQQAMPPQSSDVTLFISPGFSVK